MRKERQDEADAHAGPGHPARGGVDWLKFFKRNVEQTRLYIYIYTVVYPNISRNAKGRPLPPVMGQGSDLCASSDCTSDQISDVACASWRGPEHCILSEC